MQENPRARGSLSTSGDEEKEASVVKRLKYEGESGRNEENV
jgi:hypothetical protein